MPSAVTFADAASTDYVEAPNINVINPENSTYYSPLIVLSFNASVGRIINPRVTAINALPVVISDSWYKGDWQENATHLDIEYFNKADIAFQTNIADVPLGNRSITIGVEETFSDPDWPPVLPVRKQSYATICFVVSEPLPSANATSQSSEQPTPSPPQEASPSIPEFSNTVVLTFLIALSMLILLSFKKLSTYNSRLFKDEVEYTSKVAKTEKDALVLIEAGFEFVCDFSGHKLFKKRKN
ncbi:MAG: hypothetical protein NWF05_12025 [Candidatus Bathyarchaeota archaeon]|nr:hypothetical protein [Candidatus Bathyarchaeota archaeon]